MDRTIAEEYKSSLNDLNFNSKPLINMLTMLADENKKHAALIVNTIVNHIHSASPESKLPGLYLVDSIMKNLGNEYMKIFCQQITSLFTSVFEKVDENTRSLMFKLRQTWTEILPNKILYNLDVSVKKLDPAWPVTAKNPIKKIHINPKFLDGSVEEKKDGDTPSVSIKKEEDKIKQKQGEVLKQLLAKQEQLRQLELKKLHLTMKKKSVGIGSNNPSPNSFKQSIRDPRMVKINVPKNSSATKSSSNFATQGKPAPKPETLPSTSSVLSAKKSTVSNKAQIQLNSATVKSNINENSAEQCVKSSNQQLPQKKVSPKNKSDKCALNKNKLITVTRDKINHESKYNLIESTTNFSKTDQNYVKNEISPSKSNEKSPKGSKTTPKKKNIASNNSKIETNTNIHVDATKKKVSQMKIPKKLEKSKLPLNPDLSRISDNKINAESKSTVNVSNVGNLKGKLKDEIRDTIQKPKCAKINDSVRIEHVDKNTKSISDIAIAHKDEDLRFNSASLSEKAVSTKGPKREISDCVSASGQIDKIHPPRKKTKSEDIENCNPDYRPASPVLFGSEDQDLRHSKNDINSKDWTQYKAIHPDEYHPSPGRQDSFEGRFRSRRHRFSDFKYYYPSEYGRYGPSRHSRGRFNSRRNFRRMHFPRGMRGRWISPAASVMLDSRACLQQAEEKFRSGRISETEYIDLRRELQKMVESSEYEVFRHYFPNNQPSECHERVPEIQNFSPEFERLKQFPNENLKIQRASQTPPAIKPFVLDGKERIIHFIDDRAIALMDNNEPRELTFKDEQRKVYIDGLAEPLSLGFDGKSVEFEMDGRRHIIRFGIPGRELYINNHPYEVQFGGLPIAAMLEDGCIYKMCLSGPPPQVIIGNKPLYELFDKHIGKTGDAFKPEIKHASEGQNTQSESQSQYLISPSSASLQDIDMRVKPENIQQPDILLDKDSPFYSEDMKDVDWRHIPPSNSVDSTKNICNENAPESFETWTNEEDNRSRGPFCEDRNNQPEKLVPKDIHAYEWEAPVHQQQQMQYPPVQSENNALSPSQEIWYKQDTTCWQNNDYRDNRHPPPHEEYTPYQVPSNTSQHFEDQVVHYDPRHDQSYMRYPQRPPFQTKRIRHRMPGPNYRPWIPNIHRGGPRHRGPFFNQQPRFSSVPQKPLLPLPPFPPEFPFTPRTFILPQPGDMPTRTSVEVQNEPTSGSNESDNPGPKVDVESLLEKLIAAGIINTKPEEEPELQPPITSISANTDIKENDEPPEKIPEIDFIPESLRVHHAGVISALHKGLQCATCGMRFKELQSDQYSHHLDWHFRMNRREKDGVKKANSRRWYFDIEEWLQFEEFEDFEERVPSYFELQAESNLPEVEDVPAVISVPATSDDEECCPVCRERFQLFWVEEEEEWHYRNAVRHDKITYHPACYEDFKKACEAEEALKSSENSFSVSDEVDETIIAVVNSLLDDISKIIETESENMCEAEFIDSSKTVKKVPSGETHSEEEVLEGKPGEEEIIGVISESDMEVDTNVSKSETKMVVMHSGGITLKVKAESLQSHSPSNSPEKDTKVGDDKLLEDEEIDFRPPTPDPNFEVRPPVSRGRELSGLCCIM